MQRQAITNVLATLILGIAMTNAVGDEETTVFVSTLGEDRGDCVVTKCRTLEYGLSRMGKNQVIKLSSGQFELSAPEALFSVLSGSTRLVGGFDPVTGKPSEDMTTLLGVPASFRAQFEKMGFRVISDTKFAGVSPTERKTQQFLKTHNRLQQGLSAAPCVGGQSDGLACEAIELVAHVPLNAVSANPSFGNDIWGFIDLNTFREYVIIGYDTGAAVFDISDVENPREIGFLDGQETVWRDVKVHQRYNSASRRFEAYAYVTTDGVGDGLFVIDMTGLPHTIQRVNFSSDFSQAHNVFAANSDYATGLPIVDKTPGLVIAGSSTGSGIVRNYGLANPLSPNLSAAPSPDSVGCNARGCYAHDAASMIIRDSRVAQCPNATDHCEVLFDFNESTVDLWDITDLSDPVRLSRTSYTASRYTHSGWPTEDGMTVFVQDELDEDRGFVSSTTLRSFDLSDLTAPTRLGVWEGDTNSIDHNGFVRGNRYYMTHYVEGLTVLDITDPAAPVRVGFLDTYPFSAPGGFNGAWGAYPFFPSGLIGISDRNSGLYLARDRSLDVSQGSLSFSSESYGVSESNTVAINVSRQGGSSGAISVDYDILAVTADGSDVSVGSGRLNWADGDTQGKTISLLANADASDEGLEHLFVRLLDPTGGATLNLPNMSSVFVSESAAPATLTFASASLTVPEAQAFGSAAAVVRREGSAIGAVSVDYLIEGVDAEAGSDFDGALSGTLNWADGDARPKVISVSINNDGVLESDERFTIALSNPNSATLGSIASFDVTIAGADGLNEAPIANAGAAQIVSSGSSVSLNGSGSVDPNGDALTYAWAQTLGTTVALSSTSAASPTFTAPTVTADSLLQFSLTVSDPSGASDVATVSVTVQAAVAPPPAPSGGGGGGGSAFGLVLLAWITGMSRLAVAARKCQKVTLSI